MNRAGMPLNGSGIGRDASRPIIILAPSRSGGTLLARLLDAHPEIAILPETGMFVSLDRLGRTDTFKRSVECELLIEDLWDVLQSVDWWGALAACDLAFGRQARRPRSTARLLGEFGLRYLELRGSMMWGERTPSHILWAGMITRLFPDAHFLHLVRDPPDVVLSHINAWGSGDTRMRSFVRGAAQAKLYLSALRDAQQSHLHAFHCAHYEDMVMNVDGSLGEICGFLGVPFHEAMTTTFTSTPVSAALATFPHHRLLGGKILASRVGRSRQALSPPERALLDALFAEEIEFFGFDRGGGAGPVDRDLLKRIERMRTLMEARWFDLMPRLRGRVRSLAASLPGVRGVSLPTGRLLPTEREWHIRRRRALGAIG
jgi:hypothetical protein